MENSTFSPRLGTNYAATEQEIAQLKDLLAEPTTKLARRARLIYTDPCDQHEALSRQIEAHRALMAPMRRLPADVIQEIFLQCLPTQHNSLMSEHTAPMLLTRICSGWRSIAHSTPSLWASIHIGLPWEFTNGPPFHPSPVSNGGALLVGQNQVRGVNEWLRRSGGCSLDISIYANDKNVDASCSQEIIDLLIAVSARWGSVELYIPPRFLERFAALPVSEVPMLHALSIPETMGRPGGPSSTSLWMESGILKAPQLRRISYQKTYGVPNDGEDFTAFSLKWSQLTTVSLTIVCARNLVESTVSKILIMLRSCTSLVNCTVEMQSGHQAASSAQAINMAPVSLLYLEQLYVKLDGDSLRSLFLALEAPALQQLGVSNHFISQISDSFIAQLIYFLARSGVGANLRRLTVNPHHFKKAHFFQLIEACPNLNTLSLKRFHYETFRSSDVTKVADPGRSLYNVEDDLLRSLGAVAEEQLHDEDSIQHRTALLQKLTTFECFVSTNISDEAILDFVRARRKRASNGALAPLRRISMAMARPRAMVSMEKKLRPFVADGLKCELSYFEPIPLQTRRASDGIPSWRIDEAIGLEDICVHERALRA